ncbi:glutathione S-transferase N-terminal domain-containing protein [Methylorubrum extorquens]|uniref:glutathione S-transferase N-terminal domain-containing protein n=1 Tax=Methylorubrum extorquens TaxID=408 RepID=UPI0009D789E4|nr:glutathione S-transferase N-terminal domain-containing protein [Methylorubrum extorquens]
MAAIGAKRGGTDLMQLFYAPRSPFSRKILAAIVELGLTAQVSLVRVDPWTDETLRRYNPACKVPTLLLADGSALFDSPVIARYLDSLSENILIPPGPQVWDALRREALGDALAEAVIRRFVDQLSRRDDRLDRVVARQEAAITAILDRLEAAADWMRAPTDLGHLAIACALDYLDGRSPELAWGAQRHLLAAWFYDFRGNSSMKIAADPEKGAFRIVNQSHPLVEV